MDFRKETLEELKKLGINSQEDLKAAVDAFRGIDLTLMTVEPPAESRDGVA